MSIKLEHINYVYSEGTAYEKHALKDVSLEIPHGEFVGIIGHTGSGKSTLIQHLNGLVKATDGALYYNGENIYQNGYDMRALRNQVGLVFQYPEYQIFEETVAKDIAFGPRNMGLAEEEVQARVQETAAIVGLSEEILKQSPFLLSGGQKRRVAIAGVMAMRPEVLILDEPTVGLDVIARDEVLNMLREYMEENESSSILISSHISSDLESLCDDFYMIHAGKIILHEDTDVLLSDYAVLKVSEEEYEKLDQQYLIKIRKEAYGYRCLTNQKQFYMENYPDVVIENGKIDDLVVMMEEQV